MHPDHRISRLRIGSEGTVFLFFTLLTFNIFNFSLALV